MVIPRIGEIPVVTLCGHVDGVGLDQLTGLSEQGQTAGGLHVFGVALANQQRTARVGLEIARVLSDPTDENQWPALLVEAVGHHRTEGKPGHCLRLRGQHAAVFLEQQMSGMLGGFCAQGGILTKGLKPPA